MLAAGLSIAAPLGLILLVSSAVSLARRSTAHRAAGHNVSDADDASPALTPEVSVTFSRPSHTDTATLLAAAGNPLLYSVPLPVRSQRTQPLRGAASLLTVPGRFSSVEGAAPGCAHASDDAHVDDAHVRLTWEADMPVMRNMALRSCELVGARATKLHSGKAALCATAPALRSNHSVHSVHSIHVYAVDDSLAAAADAARGALAAEGSGTGPVGTVGNAGAKAAADEATASDFALEAQHTRDGLATKTSGGASPELQSSASTGEPVEDAGDNQEQHAGAHAEQLDTQPASPAAPARSESSNEESNAGEPERFGFDRMYTDYMQGMQRKRSEAAEGTSWEENVTRRTDALYAAFRATARGQQQSKGSPPPAASQSELAERSIRSIESAPEDAQGQRSSQSPPAGPEVEIIAFDSNEIVCQTLHQLLAEDDSFSEFGSRVQSEGTAAAAEVQDTDSACAASELPAGVQSTLTSVSSAEVTTQAGVQAMEQDAPAKARRSAFASYTPVRESSVPLTAPLPPASADYQLTGALDSVALPGLPVLQDLGGVSPFQETDDLRADGVEDDLRAEAATGPGVPEEPQDSTIAQDSTPLEEEAAAAPMAIGRRVLALRNSEVETIRRDPEQRQGAPRAGGAQARNWSRESTKENARPRSRSASSRAPPSAAPVLTGHPSASLHR